MAATAFYYTKPRDTMSGIAKSFNTTTEEICKLNPDTPLISISYTPGLEIRVPWVDPRNTKLRDISSQETCQ